MYEWFGHVDRTPHIALHASFSGKRNKGGTDGDNDDNYGVCRPMYV